MSVLRVLSGRNAASMAIGVALVLAAAGGAAATGAARSSPPVQAIVPASTTDAGRAAVYREVAGADELAARGHRGAGVTVALAECDGHNWEGCWDGAQEPGSSEGHNWESPTWYGVEG
jgi:hypothetical protein